MHPERITKIQLHCQVFIGRIVYVDLPALSSLTIYNNFVYAGEFTANSIYAWRM